MLGGRESKRKSNSRQGRRERGGKRIYLYILKIRAYGYITDPIIFFKGEKRFRVGC